MAKRPDEELRWVKREPGTKRSRSTGTPGYERDLMRDASTGALRGPTESRPADIDEILESHRPSSPRSPSDSDFFLQVIEYGVRGVIAIGQFLHENPEVREVIGMAAKEGAKKIKSKLADARAHVARRNTRHAPHLTSAESRLPITTEEPAFAMTANEWRNLARFKLVVDRLLANAYILDDENIPHEVRAAAQTALAGGWDNLGPEEQEILYDFLADEPGPELEPSGEPQNGDEAHRALTEPGPQPEDPKPHE